MNSFDMNTVLTEWFAAIDVAGKVTTILRLTLVVAFFYIPASQSAKMNAQFLLVTVSLYGGPLVFAVKPRRRQPETW